MSLISKADKGKQKQSNLSEGCHFVGSICYLFNVFELHPPTLLMRSCFLSICLASGEALDE